METVMDKDEWVRESLFGRWFLGTDIWRRYVLEEALDSLMRLLSGQVPKGSHVLDLGCGQGAALPLLDRLFDPGRLTGVEIDRALIANSREAVARTRCPTEIVHGSVLDLPLPDASVDLALCHQVLHHLSAQSNALAEFRRVLAPGGILLVAESCRSFIESSWVRLLFRHPPAAQKDAAQYLHLVRAAGFTVADAEVVTETPWWSRRDLGVPARLGRAETMPRDPTEVLMVARRP